MTLLIITFQILITLGLWLGSKSGLTLSATNYLVLASQFLALMGTILLADNFILASRGRWLERLIGGLDKVYRVHHVTGILAFVLLLNHPVLLALNMLPSAFAVNYLIPGTLLAYNAGILALWSLIGLMILTLFVRLPYHLWYRTHQLMGLPLLLAGIHTLLISSDISRFLPLKLWILAWLICGAIAYLYKLILYRYLGPRKNYVMEQASVSGALTSLSLRPLGRPMHFRPGQFAFLSFASSHLSREAHPFSIASGPEDPNLRFVIKQLGDFTKQLSAVQVGDKVKVQGPYGRFADKFLLRPRDAIFIAGGIGITPFLSLVSYLNRLPPCRIDLFYATKDASEAVFDPELKSSATRYPNLKYHPFPADQKGYLTVATIAAEVPNWKDRLILLCGPPALSEKLRTDFILQGVRSRHILFEDFNIR